VLRLGGDDPERLGPYRLKAVIGDGGMGRVYLATSPAGRAVAVKVIGPGLADQPGYRERFAREARAAMSVSGLYTASVVDADTAGERPYLATEYVPAPSLAESVAETGPLPAATVFALAGGMAEALTAIHRAGLVHRDVKPHNILLAADGPVVIDFGIAVGDGPALTAVGMIVGTPGYLAPEVLRGKDPSPGSDVFSLGCVLVYAARGTGPYGTGDPLAIAQRAATGEADLSGVPADVKALVTPMLHRDPALRPSPAQLLQHVSLSSNAVLHDGQWLPVGVRGLLSRRKQELQQALSGVATPPGMDPTATEAPPPAAPYAAPGAGPTRPAAPQAAPQAQYAAPHLAPPNAPQPGYRPNPTPTNPNDFASLHGPTPPPPPARRSRTGFFALLGIGGAAVMAAAIATVLILSSRNDGSTNTASGGHSTGASVQAAAKTSAATGSTSDSASDTSSPESTDSDSVSMSSSGSSGNAVLSYKPGTYSENQQIAADAFNDTVTLSSITVNSDGSITVKLTYTDEEPGDWTCAYETADEASMQINSDATDVSTGNDCTKDPDYTWYMSTGQSVSANTYFSQAPEGSGTWTFTLDNDEFKGSVSGISIPTQ